MFPIHQSDLACVFFQFRLRDEGRTVKIECALQEKGSDTSWSIFFWDVSMDFEIFLLSSNPFLWVLIDLNKHLIIILVIIMYKGGCWGGLMSDSDQFTLIKLPQGIDF